MMFDFADNGFGACFIRGKELTASSRLLRYAQVARISLNRLVTFVTFFAQSLLQNRFKSGQEDPAIC
jgi:hypothetical protein